MEQRTSSSSESMSSADDAASLSRLRGLISQRLGLHFDASKQAFLAEVLARRTEAASLSATQYLDALEASGTPAQLRALALELTVTETYFFRNIDQFRALAELALPERLRARAATRKLKLLSAGCASGEEPYSLAMLTRERVTDPGWEISIEALDVNTAMLSKAARGRYSSWSLRETPPEMRNRWFKGDANDWLLDASIRGAVAFQEGNLTHGIPERWARESYDVVFCRNVLMYFTIEHAQAVVARITRALAPGGYLFLGHAETLRGLSNDYHLRHTHGTFYYQRKDGPLSCTALQPAWEVSRARSDAAIDMQWTATWIETVQRASERIRTLAEGPAAAAELHVPAATSAARSQFDLSAALELLQKERFREALELLGKLPSEAVADPNVLLLRAVLLTHNGELQAARKMCAELLRLDELSTGAHYLLALSSEGLGDRNAAIDHDQTAAYLDPSFAMPRLHLGLMARRAGDRESARRELTEALGLLQREDASRLLLFGGGFGREALVALCRAELAAAGRS
jgi:chemotaxis protein methyltransferase CheR